MIKITISCDVCKIENFINEKIVNYSLAEDKRPRKYEADYPEVLMFLGRYGYRDICDYCFDLLTKRLNEAKNKTIEELRNTGVLNFKPLEVINNGL